MGGVHRLGGASASPNRPALQLDAIARGAGLAAGQAHMHVRGLLVDCLLAALWPGWAIERSNDAESRGLCRS
jgi:hypothetical protein